MKIRNIDDLSAQAIQEEVNRGARFIYYAYAISVLVITLKRTSGVYLVRPAENKLTRGLPFTLVTILLGWWGIPYGPKYTLESLRTNLRGGKDVTDEVMATVSGYMLFEENQQRKKRNQTQRL